MIERKPIVQSVYPPVQPIDQPDWTLADLDRVILADVRKAWTDCQSTRVRSAIYSYLHQVFMQVDWWSKNPEEKKEELNKFKSENPNVSLPDDEFAMVITCTADPKKVEGKMRSKWSRVLRYAAEFKPEEELLRDFLQRKGGINKCAARYTRRLRRRSIGDGKQSKRRQL